MKSDMIANVLKKPLVGIRTILNDLCMSYDRQRYGTAEFVIIANNCWGGQIYQRLNKSYNTPFIGLFIFAPDYLKLLQRFDHYMALELTFDSASRWTGEPTRYPLGKLGELEIHFMHYADAEEATSKWKRRLARMNAVQDRSRYFFKIDDRDLGTAEIISSFHELPFEHKISFGVDELPLKDHVRLIEHPGDLSVPDGVILYKRAFRQVDLLGWIRTGQIRGNLYSRLKAVAGVA